MTTRSALSIEQLNNIGAGDKVPFWMAEALRHNSDRCAWSEIRGSQPAAYDTWEEFGPWVLGPDNLLVSFRFQVVFYGCRCNVCGGSGLSAAATGDPACGACAGSGQLLGTPSLELELWYIHPKAGRQRKVTVCLKSKDMEPARTYLWSASRSIAEVFRGV